mgnify:CR=1 FL=1
MINLLHEIKEYGVQQGLPILRDSEIPLLQRILRMLFDIADGAMP